ncbi:MAG: arginine--tRNA ligase [Clostridia bacterium]|nr:arginine--tRNA ligase [Clostridia bacterium]
MLNIKKNLSKIIASKLQNDKYDEAFIEGLISVPPDEKLGDYALPCFRVSDGKNPKEKAAELCALLTGDDDSRDFFAKIDVVGAYLNFYLNRAKISSAIVSEILDAGENYGKSREGENKKVIVEFSSPNIAKPFHIGHLCSTAIGNSLSRIYDFLGYDVVRINHIGDWGTQFGKLISAYKRWGNREAILKAPMDELLKIYVRFHEEAKEHPELEDEARHYFNLLENNDPEITELWQFFVDASLSEFNRMYKKLDISFDSFAGESFYSDKMPEIVDILKEKGLLEESDGALVVRFDDPNMPPCIIIKSDGSTIYATRDIAAAVYRKRHYDFHKNIYVVGTPQTLHFKQVFSVIRKMGYSWADDCVHVGFGYVRFPDRAISTRNGDVVLLEDVLNESVSKTEEIIKNNGTYDQIENVEEAVSKIGIGAVLFEFLKNGRERDIIFDLEKMLDFEGESGPYVQYTYARGRSVLRKAAENNISFDDADYSLLTEDGEYQLIKVLERIQNVVRDASAKNEPYIVTRYIIEIAKNFNKFYNSTNVLKSDPDIRKARLGLIKAVTIVIKEMLYLIGVGVVEKM